MAGVVDHFLSCLTLDVLTDQPTVVGAGAAHVRIFTRQRAKTRKSLQILFAIEWLHIESFIGTPYELLLVVGALQVDIDFRLPLLCGDRRKHVKQFFSVFCHK